MSIRPRFDGFYRSDSQRHEEWHAGVQMVEDYVEYLKLFEEGFWLSKTHPAADLDFPTYLCGITAEEFENGKAGRDPLDRNSDLLHRTGRFSQHRDRLAFEFRHFLLVMHEFRWELQVESPERLASDSGVVYVFHPFTDSDPTVAARIESVS